MMNDDRGLAWSDDAAAITASLKPGNKSRHRKQTKPRNITWVQTASTASNIVCAIPFCTYTRTQSSVLNGDDETLPVLGT